MANLPTLDGHANASEVRPLPTIGVTRLQRYYEPLRLPARPDTSLTSCRLVRIPPRRVSRVASSTPLPCAIVITPAEYEDRDVRNALDRRPSPFGWRVGFRDLHFRGLHDVQVTAKITGSQPVLWPIGSLSRPRRPFDIEGFRRFVASPTTSIASGWNVSCRVGLAPTEFSIPLHGAHPTRERGLILVVLFPLNTLSKISFTALPWRERGFG
jgi:hypothetical protein